MSNSITNILALIVDKCRICLEHNGSINIFNSPGLLEQIKLSTAIEIKKDEAELPKNICISCKRSIRIAMDLRKKAAYTNSRLIYIMESDPEAETISRAPKTSSTMSKIKNGPHKIIRNKDLFDFPTYKIKQQFKNSNTKSARKKADAKKKEKGVPPSIENQNNKAKSKAKRSSPRKRIIHHKDKVKTKIDDDAKRKKCISVENMPTENCNAELSKTKESDVERKIDSNSESSCGPTKGDVIKNKSEGQYVCSTCNRICPSRSSLFLHARQHDKSRQFPCPLCFKSFISRSDRDKHNRVHTGEKPYKCTMCTRCFSQNSTLKAHRIIHERESQKNEKKPQTSPNLAPGTFEKF